MNCPHCGKAIETQQQRAARSRWSEMTKQARSRAMADIRAKGIQRARVARRKTAIPCP